VKRDVHDVKKGLVAVTFSEAGIYTPPARFSEVIEEHKPQIVGVSAPLATTLGEPSTIIRALEEAGLKDRVKITVGGAPVTQEYADRIGADGYAPDAPSAVDLARSWLLG
jgi:5-methyltetrahydrofolate--homocysteine methyltransferase